MRATKRLLFAFRLGFFASFQLFLLKSSPVQFSSADSTARLNGRQKNARGTSMAATTINTAHPQLSVIYSGCG